MRQVKVLLVDDHGLVREMLCDRLKRELSFQVVGAAQNGDEAIHLAESHQPDVVIMDIDMPGLLCWDAARRITAMLPSVRLIFLSAHTNDHYIEQALKVGAMAYLTKNEGPDTLVKAIREVIEDRAFFSKEIESRIVVDQDQTRLAASGVTTRASTLTSRETEVLGYLARGLAKKEIAAVMHVGTKTVEKHAENLMAKLDIHDRVELAHYAIREGYIEP